MKKRSVLAFGMVAVFALTTFSARTISAAQAKEQTKETERATQAATVLTEMMGIPEGGIPDELMSRAKGIAVIPHVVKGAMGIGGRYGKGLMAQRDATSGKWMPPSFIEIGGGSAGFQIGVEATDLVLVFTEDKGIKSLLDGKVTLGADATVAAGPIGRKASAGTDIKLTSAIYSYSRSKGLFAGVSLDGAAVTIDEDANKVAYGKAVSGQDIFVAHNVKTNPTVAPFIAALEKYSPHRTSGAK